MQGALVWNAAVVIRLRRDAELSLWQLHPRVPAVVAWTVQWVVAISLTGSHLRASLCDCLHSSAADVRLLRVLRPCHILRHQSEQRTLRAAVWLLGRQLDLNNVSLRHFIFLLSGNMSFVPPTASKVVASFPDRLL